MRQVSKFALLIAPVLLVASGCASKPSWVARNVEPKQSTQVASNRSDRLLKVAEKYVENGKPEIAKRLYEHIVEQDPKNVVARQRMLALSDASGSDLEKLASIKNAAEEKTIDSNVSRPKAAAELIVQRQEPTLARKKTAEELFADKKSEQKVELVVTRKPTPEFEVREKQPSEQPASEFAWAKEPAVNEFFPEESLLAEKFETQTTKSDEPSANQIAMSIPEYEREGPHPSQKMLASSARIDAEEWWDAVFENGTPQVNAKPLVTSEPQEAVVIEPKAEKEFFTPNPATTVASSELPKIEPKIVAEKTNWKATSVQRLCTQDASKELIQVVALLDSRDSTVRIAGLIELGGQGSEAQPASPAVRALLQDDDALVRVHAASTVRDIEGGNIEVVRHLTRLLKEDDPNVLRLSSYLLGQMGSDATEAIASLEQLRDEDSGLTSLHAAEALTRIAPQELASYEILKKALNNEVRENRLFAAASFGGVYQEGEEFAANALKEALGNEDADVRATAALSLGGLGRHAEIALPELRHAADFDLPEVREAAHTALACLGH